MFERGHRYYGNSNNIIIVSSGGGGGVITSGHDEQTTRVDSGRRGNPGTRATNSGPRV